MRIDGFRAFVEKNLGDRKLVVVSSREPYVHRKTATGIKVERPAGGLTSAMDDVLRATGGTWVAWGSGNADRETVRGDRLRVPPEKPSYTLKRVWLTHGEVTNYYHGYSNHVLWPLCHICLERVFFVRKFWHDYVRVNDRFASAVVDETDRKSIVWFHDYHLCLAPSMLRERRPEATLMHFWHIPWPNWSVLRVCPQARDLLEGILGNDLIGFQIPLFAKNFMECAAEGLGAAVDKDAMTVTYRGRTTRLGAFPISIDFDRFDSGARSKKTENTIRKIKERFAIEGRLCIGVDRLEYTKGLIKRLQAIKLFFEKYKRFRGKVTFVQIAVPTRLSEPYISYREAVEELVKQINSRFKRGGWLPVVYLDKKAEYGDLIVYYRLADVAIVSSIYDGMNLVAKEYIASQVDEKGALILSVLTGAAEELEGAIEVNPYDIEDFADRIKTALDMPPEQKRARMSLLRKQVREHDIYRWISDILGEIIEVSAQKSGHRRYLFDHIEEVERFLTGGPLALFLDYDGTLTPIVSTPAEARLPDKMRATLEKLKDHAPVAVISGRSLDDVMDRVGVDGIVYAGNHGAEVWDGKKRILSRNVTEKRALLENIIRKLAERTGHIDGVIVEDKGITASVHFRMVKARDLAELFDLFSKTVKGSEKAFRITSGQKVFEIRPLEAWNKGDAVRWVMENIFTGVERALYIGDDTTDEDAYKVLKDKGLSISVGVSEESDFYLKNQAEVKRFLEFLLKTLAPA